MHTSTSTSKKIISNSEFQKIRSKFTEQGLKVAHCHGAFDLLHPGHISHLEEAKNVGDILVVSVTSSPYINKGPGRPFFSDGERMKSLAALSCVDYVLLAEEPSAMGIIDIVKPDFYVKGSEYAKSEDDVTQNIDKEIDRVRLNGGDVYFTGGVVFSSTKLINNSFSVFPPKAMEFAKEFLKKYSFEDIKKIVEEMSSLKVLVVGDIIIDEYIFCKVQGLMSKDMAFSARYEAEERYLGGSLAVARHLSNFSKHVTVCGIVGSETHIHTKILNDLSKDMHLDLTFDPRFRTIVKRRYVSRKGIRNEYEKLLSINYLNEDDENGLIDKTDFYSKLRSVTENYDLVILTDFGHGLVDQTVMEILQEKARFLAVNCQTNSSNLGTNIITKYNRADTFTLDERELRLAYSSRSENVETLLKKLMKHLKSKKAWVTLGSLGAEGIDDEKNLSNTPALTLTIQDTIGAGDAFFSLSSLCACLDAPLEIGTFLGSISGALATNILGNAKAISKVDLLKFATALLKF